MIRYKTGYEHQLAEDDSFLSHICGFDVVTPFYVIHNTGLIHAKHGYAWDGSSGVFGWLKRILWKPFFKKMLRASLYHDIVYQAMREGHIPESARKPVDLMHKQICLEDGTPRWVANIAYKAIRTFAKSKVKSKEQRIMYTAP